jgi:hypothetical protein
MANQVMLVHFTVDVQKRNVEFVIPADVKRAFKWKNRSEVGLLIFSEAGECLYCGHQEIKSGVSIYGPDVKSFAKKGKRLHVYAFRWPSKG